MERLWPTWTPALKSLLYWVLFMFFLFMSGSFLTGFFPSQWERLAYGSLGTGGAFLALWIFLAWEKKSFADYGLVWQRGTLFNFMKGIAIGTGIFLLILLALLVFSDMRLHPSGQSWSPLSTFLYLSLIPLAWMEEIAFRSYTFLKLNQAFGLRAAQLITAIAFALYHIVQGWGVPIAFLGPAIWAWVFGLAAIWSKGIAVPTGIHVALNMMQQLLGMKQGDYTSIWMVEHQGSPSGGSIVQSDTVGLVSQLLVLASAVFLTEYFIRKERISPRS